MKSYEKQEAWDAMLLGLMRQDGGRTGWKKRRETADLMRRISQALGEKPKATIK